MKADPLALDECAEQALHALAFSIEETGAMITADALPSVTGDPTMLTQLFQNLVSNAIKFTPAGRSPVVRITAERRGAEWLVRVTDRGVGVQPAHADEIFAPFKRLCGRGEIEGSGIGLAICRKTVERHGGRIWVEPNSEVGATICFTLPVTLEESACLTA